MDGGFDVIYLHRHREDISRETYLVLITKYVSRTTLHVNGGATRDRTADPLLAKQVLSQLSYSPVRCP